MAALVNLMCAPAWPKILGPEGTWTQPETAWPEEEPSSPRIVPYPYLHTHVQLFMVVS